MKLKVFILHVSILLLAACRQAPMMPAHPTQTFSPTFTQRAPSAPEILVPSETETQALTPAPFADEEPVSPDLVGRYTLVGSTPDGKAYSAKLSVTLNPGNSGISVRQAEYDLAWEPGPSGAGILIKDVLADRFLVAGFGGSTCSAVVYYAFPYRQGDTSTFTLYGIRLEPGTFALGSEIASPVVSRSSLEGEYNLVGTNADGRKYTGSLSIAQGTASLWQLGWNVLLPTPGIGTSLNKSLFAAAYGGEGCGLSVFKLNADGSLHAIWAVWGDSQVGEGIAKK